MAQVLRIQVATIQVFISMPLALSSPIEHSHQKFERHPEQKNPTNSSLFIFRQQEIKVLFQKNVFKIVTPNKFVMPEDIPRSIQGFNFYFVDDIKD